MKRISLKGLLVAVSSVFLFAACNNAKVSGTVADAADTQIVVNRFEVSKLNPVDTVTTDAKGRFSIKLDVTKGDPEFYYLDCKGRRIASILVNGGDRLTVEADTLGNFEVKGSKDAELYSQVEKDYRDFTKRMADCAERYATQPDDQEIGKEMTRNYIQYYRDRVRFIMENSHSLAVVPVFYQKSGSLPVLNQSTDAIHYKNVCDSLETVYPNSRYVKALRKEADKKIAYLSAVTMINAATPVAFPEIELPDIKAQKRKLSEVDAKVVMVYFWSNSIPEQRQFNLEVLKPIYQLYCPKGLEIYQIALDPDKGSWASTVKAQNLPWINVCDIDGRQSRYASLYNLKSIPSFFFIKDGELTDAEIQSGADLAATLDRLLK